MGSPGGSPGGPPGGSSGGTPGGPPGGSSGGSPGGSPDESPDETPGGSPGGPRIGPPRTPPGVTQGPPFDQPDAPDRGRPGQSSPIQELPGDGNMACCSSSGDPNIRNFDGLFWSYQGGCKYNLATPSNREFRVRIIVKKIKRYQNVQDIVFKNILCVRWFGILNYLTGCYFATCISMFPLFCILFF